MTSIALVLGYKFNHEPGISLKDGVITEWPESLGPLPGDAQIAAWVIEFDETETEENLIAERAKQVAEDRDRKEAVRLLKLEGNTFKHFNKNGKRI